MVDLGIQRYTASCCSVITSEPGLFSNLGILWVSALKRTFVSYAALGACGCPISELDGRDPTTVTVV